MRTLSMRTRDNDGPTLSLSLALSLSRSLALSLQVHWFSILNSFMIVLFLSGLIAMIMIRTLRRDFQARAC